MPISQPAAMRTYGDDHAAFASMSARRLLALGGIALIVVGMLFGDIFAVFILHQNASRVGASLAQAAHASLHGDVPAVQSAFREIGGFLENRGTKVDTHVHMIDFGYLALLLALLQPWIAFSERAKRKIAWIFLAGAALLPLGVFLIHYVGVAYSPLRSIGWASIFADLGGALVLLMTLAYLLGLIRNLGSANREIIEDPLVSDRSHTGNLLYAGGLLLVLIGFAHGAYYAATDLYRHEAADLSILSRIASGAAQQNSTALDHALADYGNLQGDKAVKIAAHAHIIEFGMLAMMLAFFQPLVDFSEPAKRRWALVLLLGSVLLPVCVLMELRFGLFAGGLADFGGLLVIVALVAMWMGMLRHRITGAPS